VILNRMCLDDWRVRYLASQKIPFVCLERSLDAYSFIGVEIDSYSGVLELIAHLVGLGHKRIAYISGPPQLKIEHDRFAGYKAGLAAARIVLEHSLVAPGDLSSEGGYLAGEKLLGLAQPPTAIACVNDITAIGALHAVHKHGLKVGGDIAIAGFDGIADAAHTEPPLTTLDVPFYTVARQLAGMLLTHITGEELHEKQIKITPRLVIRASTTG